MQLFYNDIYHVDMPPGHRFPMEKYRLVRRRLQWVLGPGQLAAFSESPLASVKDLSTAHCPNYVARYVTGRFTDAENRAVGLPWSPAAAARALSSVGGTVAATHAVLRGSGCAVSGHVAGGTHHAFRDRGEGFCVFSDIAVAARVALRDYPGVVRRVLVLDLDVHQVCEPCCSFLSAVVAVDAFVALLLSFLPRWSAGQRQCGHLSGR